jgi:uncharacterized caspase-like protein
MSNLPTMFAILVGIDNYKHPFAPLNSAVSDARKIETFIKEHFRTPQENITFLQDSDATRERIIEELSLLQEKCQRNNAILFFFSGYAGRASSDESGTPVGMICPIDISEETPGIPDTTLIQLFDAISKSCGSNIVSNPNLYP